MASPLLILIIGGYGEFGGRLTQLLLRDKHNVVVAGRNLDKARQFCAINGGTPLKLDIATDLHLINTMDVDVVIDAAGPYQLYAQDEQRYRVARQALESGAHYLDLSDDGEFSRNISTLDTLAKNQRRFALSGASSTPALSGAAVHSLQTNLSSIEKIETSILPGSRAPQGRSVMLAILDQVGNPISFWREGHWQNHTGWSQPVRKRIGSTVVRNANLIKAADADLFPDYFNARSVLFRAGLAMPVMHLSLQCLGSLRAFRLLPNLTRFVAPLRWLADRLTPHGSDRGGMLVEVTGEKNASQQEQGMATYCWRLEAQPGQGPYVPTIPSRAIVRHLEQIPFGARACIGELSLAQYVEAMSDLDIDTSYHAQPFNYLFAEVLGDSWHTIPKCLQESHCVVDKKTLNGVAKITRGTSPITQLVAWIFRFPAAADGVVVQVTKTRLADSEVWVRNFNGQQFKSTLQSSPAHASQSSQKRVQERFGILTFSLNLECHENSILFPVASGSCFGIPIPKWLLPVSHTREFEKDDMMHFCVELLAPFKLGLIVRYEGWLK